MTSDGVASKSAKPFFSNVSPRTSCTTPVAASGGVPRAAEGQPRSVPSGPVSTAWTGLAERSMLPLRSSTEWPIACRSPESTMPGRRDWDVSDSSRR